MQEATEAVGLHREALRLSRALARLPLDRPADGVELDAALARDHDTMCHLAIALNNLGVALESAQQAKEAVAVHQEELRLARALARLPLGGRTDLVELDATLARDPRAVRGLAIALGSLGIALRARQQAKEAVSLHQEGLRLTRALARWPLDRDPDGAELGAALARDPAVVHDVARALETLGVTFESMEQAAKAVATHQAALRLFRAVAWLPIDRPPDEADLEAALARDPGAVRSLANAEHKLGTAFTTLGSQGEALSHLAAAAMLARAVAALATDARLEDVDAVAERAPRALRELGDISVALHDACIAAGEPLARVIATGLEALRCYGALAPLGVADAAKQVQRLLPRLLSLAEGSDRDAIAQLPDVIEVSRRVGLSVDGLPRRTRPRRRGRHQRS